MKLHYWMSLKIYQESICIIIILIFCTCNVISGLNQDLFLLFLFDYQNLLENTCDTSVDVNAFFTFSRTVMDGHYFAITCLYITKFSF